MYSFPDVVSESEIFPKMERDFGTVKNDVMFLVGDERETAVKIPANKQLLSIKSPVFKTMFNGPFLENNSNEVFISDISPIAFRDVLRYIHRGRTAKTESFTVLHCLRLLYIAEKYQISSFITYVLEALMQREVTLDNFYYFLVIYDNFKQSIPSPTFKDIKWKINRFQQSHAKELIFQAEFTELSYQMVLMFVKGLLFNSIDVKDLFDRVYCWAKDVCFQSGMKLEAKNVRQVLGKIIHYVAFGMMSLTDFTEGPVAAKIMTEDEIIHFTYLIKNSNCLHIHPWPSKLFPIIKADTLETNFHVTFPELMNEENIQMKLLDTYLIVCCQKTVLGSLKIWDSKQSVRVSLMNCQKDKSIYNAILTEENPWLKGPFIFNPKIPYVLIFQALEKQQISKRGKNFGWYLHNGKINIIIEPLSDVLLEQILNGKEIWKEKQWKYTFNYVNNVLHPPLVAKNILQTCIQHLNMFVP